MKHSLDQIRTQDGTSSPETCTRGRVTFAKRSDRPKRNGESGEGKLKSIVWTLIFAALVYVGYKVTPILVNEYEFQDDIQTLARMSTINRHTPDQIRDEVLKDAQRDDIPVDAEGIKVQAMNGNVKIDVSYSVTVDLGVYQWTLNLNPTASNNSIV